MWGLNFGGFMLTCDGAYEENFGYKTGKKTPRH